MDTRITWDCTWGRVWVIGAALAYLAWLARAYWRMALLALAAAVMLGGLVASFSKGALLGVPFAAVVLVGMLWRTRRRRRGSVPFRRRCSLR